MEDGIADEPDMDLDVSVCFFRINSSRNYIREWNLSSKVDPLTHFYNSRKKIDIQLMGAFKISVLEHSRA